MTVWFRYNFIFFCGPLLSFLTFFIFISMGSTIVGLIIMGFGIMISVIFLLSQVCPSCKTHLYTSNSIFSKHYKGYQIFIPEKCINCGYDLNQPTHGSGHTMPE